MAFLDDTYACVACVREGMHAADTLEVWNAFEQANLLPAVEQIRTAEALGELAERLVLIARLTSFSDDPTPEAVRSALLHLVLLKQHRMNINSWKQVLAYCRAHAQFLHGEALLH